MSEMNDIKKEMKDRARLARGLANALGYDTEYILTDVKAFDIMCLEESLRETKLTIQKLIENIDEIEYLLHLVKREGSRNLQPPL